jgi:ribosomal protein L34E
VVHRRVGAVAATQVMPPLTWSRPVRGIPTQNQVEIQAAAKTTRRQARPTVPAAAATVVAGQLQQQQEEEGRRGMGRCQG